MLNAELSAVYNVKRMARFYFNPLRLAYHVPEYLYRTTGNFLKYAASPTLKAGSFISGLLSVL